jgi:hypothetical protein
MLGRAFATGDMDELEGKGAEPMEPTAPAYGDGNTPGGLLAETDDAKVAAAILKGWTEQDALWSKHRAECLAAAYRREGRTDVVINKKQNIAEYQVQTWGNVDPQFNYLAELCRKLPSILYADPPQPKVEPEDLDTHDETTAELVQRVLLEVNADTYLDGTNTTRSAFDLASTYKSAFVWTSVVAQGARQPIQIEAHPMAAAADQPLQGPPQVDPFTQAEMPGMPLPANEAVMRYVTPEGGLQDEMTGAALQWVPRLREEVLTSLQVRPLPPTAPDLWHAHGVQVALFLPLREWQALFPETLGTLTDEIRGKLAARPEGAVKYLLHHLDPKAQQKLLAQDGDDLLVFGVCRWHGEMPDYPSGFYGAALGSGVLAHKGTWAHPQTQRGLTPPLSQIMQYREGTRSFYGGAGAADILGPMQEVFAQTIQYEQDVMDSNAHRKTFVPLGSPVTPEEYEDPGQRMLVAGPGGVPFQEQIEPLDPTIKDLAALAERHMRDAIGLSETAQGLDSGNINSGRQAFAVIGQAQAALSEPRQHRDRFECRRWQIQVEQLGAFFTVPQLLRYAGDDGEIVVQRWTGDELGTTRTVRIKPGTGTLLTPQQKVEQTLALAANPATGITPAMVQAVVSGGMALDMGFTDDPQKQRIERQLARWEQGKPEGWVPVPPQPQVVGVNPDGSPAIQMIPTPDPVMLAIFNPLPSDDLPTVALQRTQVLADYMAGSAFAKQDPAWQQGVIAELDRARRAAGVATVAEQQQAAMQQAQQQAAAPLPRSSPESRNTRVAQTTIQQAQSPT